MKIPILALTSLLIKLRSLSWMLHNIWNILTYKKPNNEVKYINFLKLWNILSILLAADYQEFNLVKKCSTNLNIIIKIHGTKLVIKINWFIRYHHHQKFITTKKKSKKKITWFNPPYNQSVSINLAGTFLNLKDKSLPPLRISYKIFNRNIIKLTYSCRDYI